MKILVCTGEIIRNVCTGNNFISYRPEDRRELLEIEDLMIIVQMTCDWEPRAKDGQHFICQLRLEYDCIHPIVLTYIDRKEVEDGDFSHVLQDPYVELLSFPKLIALLNDVKQLYSIFGNIQEKKDRALLLQDLKQTLYRKQGYIFEIKHQLTQALGKLNTFEQEAFKPLFAAHWKEVERVFSIWNPSGSIENRFHSADVISNLDAITNQRELMSYLNEQFDRAGEAVNGMGKNAASPVELHQIKVIYISDSEQNRLNLSTRFADTYAFYHITCISVADEREAIQVLEQEKSITAVICDYRFYDKAGKISKVNGYLIIRNLQKKFPARYYCLLTDYHLDGILSLAPTTKEVYIKWNTLDPSGTELARLARAIMQWDQVTFSVKEAWPKALNKAEDESWRDHYRTYREQVYSQKSEKAISDQALAVLTEIISGNLQIVEEIPKVSSYLSRVSVDPIEALKDRLLLRRIVIGLLQYGELSKVYPKLAKNCKHTKSAPNNFALIFHILHPDKAEHKALWDGRTLSNYFSGCLRLMISKKYHLRSKNILDRITHAELEWLETARKKLKWS